MSELQQLDGTQNSFNFSLAKIDASKIGEAFKSDDGTNIAYLSLESEGAPGVGIRISKQRFIDKRSVDFWAKQPDYLSNYFGEAFLKPGLVRTLISEVQSSGIHQVLENGVTIETPELLGHALVNRNSGETILFPYPSNANSDTKLDIVKKMLIDQAEKLKTEDGWDYGSVVSHIDGLGDKTRFRPAADYLNPILDSKDYISGLDSLQASSELVIALKKKGLACVDPGSNPPLYDSSTKTCVLADIGSFGFTDNRTQQAARMFIRGIEKDSAMKQNKTLDEIYNNQDIFVEFGSTDDKWEEFLRLSEIKKQIKGIAEVPHIRFMGMDQIREHWEKVRDVPYDRSKSEARIEQNRQFIPYGGRPGIDLLMISLQSASTRIERSMNEIINYAGRDSFFVNSGRNRAENGLIELTESHGKVKQLFSDIFGID